MNKKDFKKLALMGIASGTLIASQANASSTMPENGGNDEGTLLAGRSSSRGYNYSSCGGNSGCQGQPVYRDGGSNSCQSNGCHSNNGGNVRPSNGCHSNNGGNVRPSSGGGHGCHSNNGGNVRPSNGGGHGCHSVKTMTNGGGSTTMLSANGCASHGCGGQGGGKSAPSSDAGTPPVITPAPSNGQAPSDNSQALLKKRTNLQSGGNTAQAPNQGR